MNKNTGGIIAGMLVAAFLGGFLGFVMVSYLGDTVDQTTTTETVMNSGGDVQVTTSTNSDWTVKLVVHLALASFPALLLLWLATEAIRYLRAGRKVPE